MRGYDKTKRKKFPISINIDNDLLDVLNQTVDFLNDKHTEQSNRSLRCCQAIAQWVAKIEKDYNVRFEPRTHSKRLKYAGVNDGAR